MTFIHSALQKLLRLPRRRPLFLFLIALILLFAAVMAYQTHKPLPPGLSLEGQLHRISDSDIEFLYDLTYQGTGDGQGIGRTEQMIFERTLQAIGEARQFIVVDMFLYNGYYNRDQSFPPLSRKLTEKLIAQKTQYPELKIVVITDEINTSYGSHPSPELELLKAAGITTVLTDVDPLRDSSPLYSAGWRIFGQWFGQAGHGWVPNPMADTAPDMTVRSYAKLLNVKANHRKVIITERTLIVASANAHDASFYNSNSGFLVKGAIVRDALVSEQAAVNMSAKLRLPAYSATSEGSGEIGVRLLTEGMILKHVLLDLSEAGEGDTVWMGMFYLADRQVIRELLQAAARGADVRLILDPNENAFGNDKIGIPNRPVAAELLEKSEGRIQVRWYRTGSEQYHTKLLLIEHPDRMIIHNGSANLTTRNLADLNLETNLQVVAPSESRTAGQVRGYFTRLWNNQGGMFTLDYSAYKDERAWLKRVVYTVQRWLGFTTF
ncbi:PLD-like domain-containing protein [Paenibacillus sp. UNCCL117]|uniref:phospholipase D family protein n=1 Tax=unclassified Paenibacillus TaxID=185978 RepID=UPI00088B72C1|nr:MULTISPECIES: phospholipase D family protein [unclassified Paenibacillus]SDD11758.1 PLD-like domain-containing protein [Paenibacillus sp. cl123]SFW33643.1 PLD-like domain-containing protein [Paenibacillus sp. UNCCL117]